MSETLEPGEILPDTESAASVDEEMEAARAADRRARAAARMRLRVVLVLLGIGAVASAGYFSVSSARGTRAALEQAEKRAAIAEQKASETDAIVTLKDTLLSELMTSTKFINDINDELSKIRTLKHGTVVSYGERMMPMAEYRESMLARIRELGQRLDESDRRLTESSTSLRIKAAGSPGMSARLAAFEQQIAQYRAVIASQRTQIETLTSQVETLQNENARLVREKRQLNEQVLDLAEAANTVFYIAATRAQLLEMEIITEEGGKKRFLGIGSRPPTLQISRNLHEADFTPVSKTADLQIRLPNPSKTYRIVSRQDVSALEPAARDGLVRGVLHIADPARFWAASKFLILMEQ